MEYFVEFRGRNTRIVRGVGRDVRIEPGYNCLSTSDLDAASVQVLIQRGQLTIRPANGSFSDISTVDDLTALNEAEALRAVNCGRPDQLRVWRDPRPTVKQALNTRREMYIQPNE